ncbi:hypothetical protein C8R47DRAFT_996291 [Mycena vitilis]|nr:hypothetical protein C8R47DRAFT_996291 [Mycena vitilis]
MPPPANAETAPPPPTPPPANAETVPPPPPPRPLPPKPRPAWPAAWFRDVFAQISRETLAMPYQALLRAYMEFEESRNWVQKGGLPQLPRPAQVGQWIRDRRGLRDGRAKDKPAEILHLGSFKTNWWAWWTALQPSWRGAWRGQRRAGVVDTVPEGADWGKLRCSGQNRVLSIVASLYWWVCAEKEKEVGPSAEWLEAVEDVTYAMRAMKL